MYIKIIIKKKLIVITVFTYAQKNYKKYFLKYHLNCFKCNVFVFQKCFKKFLWIYKNGKSELENTLKLLKNHLSRIFCFHNVFKTFL